MEKLAYHNDSILSTSRVVEVNKIRQAERTHKTSAKHKWYLTEQHGMMYNLLVPYFMTYEILPIIGLLAFNALV